MSVTVAVPILVLKLCVSPFRRGFYCDDESIAHPHKSDTVPLVAVVCVSIALFFICVSICVSYSGHGDKCPKCFNLVYILTNIAHLKCTLFYQF